LPGEAATDRRNRCHRVHRGYKGKGAANMTRIGLLVAVVALGCGTDTRFLEGADGAVEGGTGGVGGQPSSGTGGAPANSIGNPPITPGDATSCEEWPLCPDGVFSPISAYGLSSELCGLGHYCSLCRDTRGGTCSGFVGRCRAPIVGSQTGRIGVDVLPGDCVTSPLDTVMVARCTGAELRRVICEGADWPTP
jgi:hypothetical protein